MLGSTLRIAFLALASIALALAAVPSKAADPVTRASAIIPEMLKALPEGTYKGFHASPEDSFSGPCQITISSEGDAYSARISVESGHQTAFRHDPSEDASSIGQRKSNGTLQASVRMDSPDGLVRFSSTVLTATRDGSLGSVTVSDGLISLTCQLPR